MAERSRSIALERVPPSGVSTAGSGYSCEFTPFVGVAKLQTTGPGGEAILRDRLGAALPGPGREVEVGEISCAWLGPREWLLTGPEAAIVDLAPHLNNFLGNDGIAVDLTHARAVYVLRGAGAREILAGLCPLDLSNASAPVGFATRSLLGDTGMFLARKADENGSAVFVIAVDQTMAAYASRMLAAPQLTRGVTS